MARISAAPPEKFAEVSDHMERWKKLKGYPPNSWLTMVRKPKVFRAYRDLHTDCDADRRSRTRVRRKTSRGVRMEARRAR